MGAGNTGGGAGGNTGADAGFFVSEQKKKEKINESGYGADYQGEVNNKYSKEKKKKTTVVNNGGGNNGGGNDGNNTIAQVTATAPTTAEVSQATTTEADADTEANRLLKVKKRGRSASIMTSAKGVTKTSTDYSLGKKSLLGRV
jgi:hypothetical protein